MRMILHQAIGVDLPAGFGATFIKSFDKPPFVVIIFQNGLAPIPPVYRVIDRAWIFDPNLASHKAEDGFRSALVKSKVAKLGTARARRAGPRVRPAPRRSEHSGRALNKSFTHFRSPYDDVPI